MRSSLVLLLCAFICLTSAASPCVQSGFGNENGVCVDKATPAQCTSVNTVPTLATNYPTLDPTSSFTGNTLTASLSGAYTAGRQYLQIYAGTPNGQCNLEGSFWDKTFSTTACQDKFTLTLPWLSHSDCGFGQSETVGNFIEYTTQVRIFYRDLLPSVTGQSGLTRDSSTVGKIVVSFPKTVTLSIENVVVNSSVAFEAALTQDEYNPNTLELTLELTTVMQWPNQLAGPASFSIVPVNIHPNASAGTVRADVPCDGTRGSLCVQTWTTKFSRDLIAAATLCNFDGDYKMDLVVYTCRGDSRCTNAAVSVQFSITGSNVCASVQADVITHGYLRGYASDPSVAAAASTTQFFLGSTGFFRAEFTDEAPESVVFANITLNKKDGNPVAVLFSTTDPVHADAVHVHVAVANAQSMFSLYFDSRMFNTVKPFSSAHFVINAVLQLTYAGNQKRSVEYSWDAATPVASTSSIKFALAAAPAQASVNQQSVNPQSANLAALIGGIIGGVAGLAILSVGVAFLVIKYNNNKSRAYASA